MHASATTAPAYESSIIHYRACVSDAIAKRQRLLIRTDMRSNSLYVLYVKLETDREVVVHVA